ncbi:MAG: DUF1569 domain-containing protein [Phycisphaerales bacterium]
MANTTAPMVPPKVAARGHGAGSVGLEVRGLAAGAVRPALPRGAVRGKVTQRPMLNTKKSKHRMMRLRSLADLEREVDRLAALERAGRLMYTGNWTLGQTLGHLAAWIDFFYTGFPMPKPPALMRLVMPLFKGRFLNGTMPKGMRIPKVSGGTLGTEALTTEQGLVKFKGALGRLKGGDVPRYPSPVLGPMTLDEVTRLTLRHAELHLGFCDG